MVIQSPLEEAEGINFKLEDFISVISFFVLRKFLTIFHFLIIFLIKFIFEVLILLCLQIDY